MIKILMMTQCASYPVSSGSVAVLLRWVLWPSTLNPSQRILLTAHHQQHCDAFPYQIGPIIGPVRFTFRPRVDQHVHRLTVGLSRHWICRDRPIVMISYRVWQHLGSLDGEVAVPRDSPSIGSSAVFSDAPEVELQSPKQPLSKAVHHIALLSNCPGCNKR